MAQNSVALMTNSASVAISRGVTTRRRGAGSDKAAKLMTKRPSGRPKIPGSSLEPSG